MCCMWTWQSLGWMPGKVTRSTHEMPLWPQQRGRHCVAGRAAPQEQGACGARGPGMNLLPGSLP